jgi:heme/copper-type cytochrome/quinol oxidase subunit 3
MDLVETGAPGEVLPAVASGPRAIGWWGMALFIATEATVFGLLIASYWYLRFRSGPVWPPDGVEAPKIGLPLVMSAILWSSSVPVHVAHSAIRKGRAGMLRFGLLLGFLLGLAFLALELGVDYPEALSKHPPSSGAYGSLYFGLTGLHAVHVIVGLCMSLWVQVRAWRGAFDRHRHVTVQNFTMYWHFVDVVWLFVLATVYLAPRL